MPTATPSIRRCTQALENIVLGGALSSDTLPAHDIALIGDALGLDATDQGRAVNNLIGRGLVSVERTGSVGAVRATEQARSLSFLLRVSARTKYHAACRGLGDA